MMMISIKYILSWKRLKTSIIKKNERNYDQKGENRQTMEERIIFQINGNEKY